MGQFLYNSPEEQTNISRYDGLRYVENNLIFYILRLFYVSAYIFSGKQAFWGALVEGRGKEGELAALQLCLWNLNSTSNSPVASCRLSCQISANQREVEMSASVNKHWKTRDKGNCVITNVNSVNQHFVWTVWCWYSNARDVVGSSPSFSHPATRAPRTTFSQASKY